MMTNAKIVGWTVNMFVLTHVPTRGVESKSLEVGKSLKIGKNRIKSEKSEFIFY